MFYSVSINYLFLSLLALACLYGIHSSSLQCSRHTSRYRDVPSLALTSSLVLDATPLMTSSARDVTNEGMCDVMLRVRKVFKNNLPGLNSTGLTRIRVKLCVNDVQMQEKENLEVQAGCAGRVFKKSDSVSYLVFLNRAERVINETRTVVELVSVNPPVESNKQELREVRKYSRPKFGRKPSASLSPDKVKVTSLHSVDLKSLLELNCRVSGNPLPEVEWLHNGDPIDITDTRYKIKNTKRGSRLRISRSERRDCGEYHCRAMNVLGESSSHSVYVTINPDLTCSSQHTHPCTQQSYCMNGGTCWVLTAVGTEFCECTTDYEGERCMERKYMPSIPDQAGIQIPVIIASVVFGILTLVVIVTLFYLVSRRFSGDKRKKRISRDLTAAKSQYNKLSPDLNNIKVNSTLRSMSIFAFGPEKRSADNAGAQMISGEDTRREQETQTVLSLMNGKVPPFIHVQIHSAVIQPSDQHPGFQDPQLLRGLQHVDSVTSTGRERLSAISTTPGVDLDEQGNEYFDDLDGLEEKKSPEGRDSNGNLQHEQLSPEFSVPMSAPAMLDGLFLSSRFSGITISSPTGSVIMPSYEIESNLKDQLEGERYNNSLESQRKVQSNKKVKSDSVKLNSTAESIQRNISNPDLLESIQERTSSTPITSIRTVAQKSKKSGDPYDSDPDATVV